MKDLQDRIHWHGAFFEAVQIEFHDDKDVLSFEKEHELSKESLWIDVLVIKKEKSAEIKKNIGKIFREFNVLEFKSTTDYIAVHDFNKALGYSFLYSAFQKVPKKDITVTLVSNRYPRDLIKYLEYEEGLEIEAVGEGIYYAKGGTFPIQILEQKKLSSEENLFLKNLSNNINENDATRIIEVLDNLGELSAKNAYLDAVMAANRQVFQEVSSMSAVMKEIFLEAAEKNGWYEERDKERIKERMIAQAKEMLQDGEPLDKIVKYTKLPLEVVRTLLQS